MRYRKLGNTNLDVSEIGLGTEYLNGTSKENIASVVHEAIDYGVNYIDLLFAFQEYRDSFGAALAGKRDKVIIAGHLGSVEANGQYKKTTNKKESERYFLDLLKRLNTDYVDILMIHNVNSERLKDFEPGGLVDLALRFQAEGKARFIGMSGHLVPAALKAVRGNKINVLMFPVNVEKDATPGKSELFLECIERNIGLVAMKPFAGGKLLQSCSNHGAIAPVKCISYCLAQPGVACLVAGVKSNSELQDALKYYSATSEEINFSELIEAYGKGMKGSCVYCNHCQPCPSGINIGEVLRMVDKAPYDKDGSLNSVYNSLKTNAAGCIECRACMKRCPYEVDVISMMRKAVELFSKC